MKTAFTIIGIIVVTFILIIILAVVLNDPEAEPKLNPTNVLTEAERAYSDSIVAYRKKAEDSMRTANEAEKIVKREAASKALKNYRTTTDEFDDTSYFHHPQSPKYTNRNFIYPYIGKTGESYWLRLIFQYTADDWLFIERVKIKTDTGQYELSPQFERDNNSDIWEWADIGVSLRDYRMLRDMAGSKEVLIRYEGAQYQKDRKLTSKEKNVINETLDVFDVFEVSLN